MITSIQSFVHAQLPTNSNEEIFLLDFLEIEIFPRYYINSNVCDIQ